MAGTALIRTRCRPCRRLRLCGWSLNDISGDKLLTLSNQTLRVVRVPRFGLIIEPSEEVDRLFDLLKKGTHSLPLSRRAFPGGRALPRHILARP